MKFIDLLEMQLKDDFLLDLFETYDVDVSYCYDRTHEGIEDEYRASIEEMGLEFLFNDSQKLIAVFMRKITHDGFNPFKGDDPRDTVFKNGSEAIEHAEKESLEYQYQESKEGGILGRIPEWIKFDFGRYTIHYQFDEKGVDMVTLQAKNA